MLITKQIYLSCIDHLRMKKTLFLFALLSMVRLNAQVTRFPFQDEKLPVEERVKNIISLLTLDEKIACLSTLPSVPRLGIKGTAHSEGLHGLAMGGPAKWGPDDRPVPTTQFPQAYGLGETWDPAMVRLAASVEGFEARYIFQRSAYNQGGLVIRAPNADLGRDPRWGRTEECYGEDAFFNGVMASAFVKGLQGNHPRYWQTASLLKHFLANSNEDGRDSSSSDFDERLWREYYSVPFRKAIEAGSQCYMAAYNRVNGIPATVHPMHKNIAMKQWGLNGIICTDGGAYQMLVNSHHYYPDLNKAAAACIKSGINQFLDDYREGVYGALANGYLQEKDLDEVIAGNFRVMIKLGLLDPDENNPYAGIGIKDTIDPWTSDQHKAAARLVTQKSIVLLKNNNNFLPLDTTKITSVAIVGSLAKQVNLDWYSGTPPYVVSPLEGISKRAGSVKIMYAENNQYNKAVDLAQRADVVIVCVGNHPLCNSMGWKDCPSPGSGKEAVDRKSISLEDEELVRSLYAVNPNTMVVLMSSFPYAINWSQQHVPAILHLTHNSQELGNALADVLFGDYNPAGRLTQTWPVGLSQLPPMMDYNIRNGRTYQYRSDKPLYPFGYGLSYSSFHYSELKLTREKDSILVAVEITNTGKKDGEEVAQVYIRHLNSTVVRPLKELKAFQRTKINAGESRRLEIRIALNDLKYWNSELQQFVLEKNTIEVMIGASSEDIRLKGKIKINE